jgi:hypothetical protein
MPSLSPSMHGVNMPCHRCPLPTHSQQLKQSAVEGEGELP